MNTKGLWFYVLLVIFLAGCGEQDGVGTDGMTLGDADPVNRDLAEIKRDGVLKALTTYSATSYFLYKGKPMGYEYELLERFAASMNLELELILVRDIDSLIHYLNTGEADLIAHGLAITNDRKERVEFTEPLYSIRQVLVQRKPEGWRKLNWKVIDEALIHDPMDLIGDTVSVRKNSSYFKRLKHLEDELGGDIFIDTLPGNLSTDEIIKMVVDGVISYTVADENIAAINASYYPILDIQVPISFSQRIAWAVRQDSKKLLDSLNAWIGNMQKKNDYYVIYNKYYKNRRDFRRRSKSEFLSLNENKISPYDEMIRQYADSLGWDWRLLASLVYQESRFDPKASSWSAAHGLMQLMPATAIELGVTNRSDPEQSLKGGTLYLERIWEEFSDVNDSLERIKFTMAAFNCGTAHVRDAQRLAVKKGLSGVIWENHVADMILALSYPKNYNDPVVKYGYVRGIEPYTYVEQILHRYKQYKQLIEQQTGQKKA